MTLVSLLLTSVVIVLALWLCVALGVLAYTATVLGTAFRDDDNTNAARS
jgi:hypothetical protein